MVTGGSKILKNEENFLKGVYIAVPKVKRVGDIEREPVLPATKKKMDKPTLKEIEE